jgi:acyl-CoA thioesterase I
VKPKILLPIIILTAILGIIILYLVSGKQSSMEIADTPPRDGEITYIPIGDSYTIGNGVAENERWPNVLTKHLNEAGINVKLIANPAVSGYTVEDAVRIELPVIKRLQPDFVTVLIGANDNFMQKDSEIYKREFVSFLDDLQLILKNPKHVVLITIPDYSKSPAAIGNNVEGVSESVEEYNVIIKSEAEKRDLKVADIFPVSQTMTGTGDYISDLLHPSAAGLSKWEKVIYPVVFDFLKE